MGTWTEAALVGFLLQLEAYAWLLAGEAGSNNGLQGLQAEGQSWGF